MYGSTINAACYSNIGTQHIKQLAIANYIAIPNSMRIQNSCLLPIE